MRLLAPLVRLAAAALLVAACTGSAASPSPQPTTPLVPAPTPADPTPVVPAPSLPSAGPDAQTVWLRLSTTQAIAPQYLFAAMDPLAILGDGRVITGGAVPAIFPGPLVFPLLSRQLSDAGRAAILKLATDLGLLGRQTDFTGGPVMAGGQMGHITIAVNGKDVELTGTPSAEAQCAAPPCTPAPATPEAFGEFWRRLLDMPSWLGAELGPEAPYAPTRYAVLTGPAPEAQSGISPTIADWPLADQLSTMGREVMNGQARCATFEGAAADTLRVAFAKANQLTAWTQDPTFNASYGLTVVPLMPGQDRCGEIFGSSK